MLLSKVESSFPSYYSNIEYAVLCTACSMKALEKKVIFPVTFELDSR